MAYIIHQFDGLSLPLEIQSGDQQDIGTGSALTAFTQLAGGGYFDNYGDNRSPQGIRPITKRGLLIADTNTELRTKLDALRAKIGVRGRLGVLYDDNTTRWQWARLQSVSTPRPSDAKSLWLPVELTFISADQSWRGSIHGGDAWTWGDGSWIWGDGSAEFGDAGNSIFLTTSDSMTLTNAGNISAMDLKITLSLSPTSDAELSSITISNSTQSPNKNIILTKTVVNGDTVVIDCGARSVTHNGSNAYASVTTLTDKVNWIPLYPGDNDIDISLGVVSGTAGCTVKADWTDYWA